VKIEDIDAREVVEYQIVFPEEVDPAAGYISLHSPIGQALLHKAVGDEIEVVTPQGKQYYQIVSLLTLHDLNKNDGF
jgi:transcription elongation factor GreA